MSATPSPSPSRMTTAGLRSMRAKGERVAVLTAYDWTMARIFDAAGIDILLVGDSLGMVVQGHDTTLPVTMDQMVYHTAMVARGATRAMVCADLPFLSYQTSVADAMRSAGRLLQEGHAQAVKVEGGHAVAATVAALTDVGIPVMGHVGLTPQSVHQFGSWRARGTGEAERARILDDALALQEAGAFAIVLEKIPASLAAELQERLEILTIGIGAGAQCDGQVLVAHDLLGLFDRFKPRFVRRYAELAGTMRDAVQSYVQDVRSGDFPNADETPVRD